MFVWHPKFKHAPNLGVVQAKVRQFIIINQARPEKGAALLLTLIVVTIALLMVMDMGTFWRFDVSVSRRFSESVQAQFMLKSLTNFATFLIELPKGPGIAEDSLSDPWALIGGASSLPLGDFPGEARLFIVDETGKIDVNAIAPTQSTGIISLGETPTPTPVDPDSPQERQAAIWRNALRDIFFATGFEREQIKKGSLDTLGETTYDAATQVAVIHDWIDADSRSFSLATFDGAGIESRSPKEFFFNRSLMSLSELLMVPGFNTTRLARTAAFLRVSPKQGFTSRRINVNTAPLEVLLALGIPQSQAVDLVQERLNLPLTLQILNTLTAGNPDLAQVLAVTSDEFAVYSRVVMTNSVRWQKAVISVTGVPSSTRKTDVLVIENY